MEPIGGIAIGLVGLGAMGRAIAERLVASEVELVVANRTRAVADAFAETHGVRCAKSPRDLAKRVDVVLTCVADADALHEVCTGRDGLLAGLSPGALLIDMGTTGPRLVERLAPRVTDLDADILECPVAGTPARARHGGLTLLVGGEQSIAERARPLLRLLGQPVYVGPLGTGTTLKLAVNTVLFCLNHATAEALLLAGGGGIDPETFLTVLRASPAGAVIHDFLKIQYLDPAVSVGAGTIATVDKDLDLACQAATELRLELSLVEHLRQVVGTLTAEGHGSAEIGMLPHILGARRAGRSMSAKA